VTHSKLIAIALRFGDVTVPEAVLESALGDRLDRYELSRTGTSHYAQINLEGESDPWLAIVNRVQQLGPRLQSLVERGSLAKVTLDLAIAFPDGIMSTSINLPSNVTEILARHNIEVELSVYRTSAGEK